MEISTADVFYVLSAISFVVAVFRSDWPAIAIGGALLSVGHLFG